MTTPSLTPESIPQAPSVGIVSSDWLGDFNVRNSTECRLWRAMDDAKARLFFEDVRKLLSPDQIT